MEPQLAEDDRPPATLTLDEYLSSNWRPDCDFVDGRAEERNVGTYNHSRTVTWLICSVPDRQEPGSFTALPSLRMRVSSTRVRVPDVCVIRRGGPKEQILTHPPLAVIEVLDEEDRFSATIEKLADLELFGVKHIWMIDPDRHNTYQFAAGGLEKVQNRELTVPETPIRVVLSELFAELDRA